MDSRVAEEATFTRASLLRLAGLGLGGVVLSPVFAACGDQAGGGSGPAAGGTLTVAGRGLGQSADPLKSLGFGDEEIIVQIYDMLVYADAEGNIYPGLATSWEVSPDGTTLTFTLRKGIEFHDGTPFNAEAVKFNIDRWKDPKGGSVWTSSLGSLEKVSARGEHTVVFRYSQPYAPALVNLATMWGAGGMASPTAVAKHGDQFGRNPVGTGPYRFVSWTEDTLTLERNPAHKWSTSFYKGPNGKSLDRGPVLDKVELRVIPEDTTRAAALVSQEIDMIAGLDAVPINQIAELKDNPNLDVYQVPRNGVTVIIPNAGRAPLTDPRTRQALSHAIDREKLVTLALAGQARPATSSLPSSVRGYDPSVAPYYEYDPEKARSLLAATGQADGFQVDYLLLANGTSDADKRAAQIMQEDLAKLSIKMNVEVVAASVFFANHTGKPLPERAHLLWNTASFSDPDFLAALFHSGGPWSRVEKDPELDRLLDEQAAELDEDRRLEVIARIQQVLAAKMYILPLYEPLGSTVAGAYVGNVHLDGHGIVHYQELTRS